MHCPGPPPRLPAQEKQAQRRGHVAGETKEVVDSLRERRLSRAAITFAGKERGDQIAQSKEDQAEHSESSWSRARQ